MLGLMFVFHPGGGPASHASPPGKAVLGMLAARFSLVGVAASEGTNQP